MLSIQEKILLYFDLPEEEQAELLLQVSGNTELEALYAESQALHSLLAASAQDVIPDASALTDFVLYSAMKAGNPPADLAAHYANIESAVRENPALLAQVETIRTSLRRLTETAEDPIARFDRLTAGPQAPAMKAASDREAIARRKSMRILRPMRWALAACVALVAVYGVLAIFSWQFQSERTQLSALHNAADVFQEMTFRGESSEPASDALDESLELLQQARTSTLGLFPSYDEERLEAAAVLAEQVALVREEPTLRSLRANYILGKIRTYQGRDAEATEALQKVVDGQGEGAEDARRLLDFIRTRVNEEEE